MSKITVQQLKDHYACNEQVRKFKRTFGNEVTVTLKNLLPHSP